MSEENNQDSSGTLTIKKESLWKYSTFILVAVLIVGAFVFFTNNDSTGTGNVVAGNNGQKVSIEVGDAPVIGSESAPVTIVEFSDFSCPFCAAVSGDNKELADYMKSRSPDWEPAVSNIMKDYVETGKVRFAAKYSMGHSGGHPAQLVSWCLNEQSLYWKFYPLAFANQNDVENLDKMKALAKGIGADMTKLQTCLDSGKYDDRFDKEQAEGQKAGVQGTPAFFVNGQLIEGAQPYSVFKQAIDAELAK